jgi:drug/metabolite transporter (DMT)-like permease
MITNSSYRSRFSLPLIILFGGILAVSSASILIKFAQDEVNSIVIAAYRLTIATIFLVPFVMKNNREELRSIKGRDNILILLSGLFLALHFATWISSLRFTSIASSVVIVTTTPLWVALFSPLFLGEKIKSNVWIGIIIAMMGSTVVGLSEGCYYEQGTGIVCQDLAVSFHGKAMIGNFLALIGAWMAAGYMITGRKLRSHLSVTPYVFCVYGVASIILIGIIIVMGYPVVGFSPKIYGWLLLLGLVPQLLGHSSFNWALGYLPAAFVSVALMGEPIGTILLAYIILAEIPLFGELAGGVLILAGILLVSLANVQSKKAKVLVTDQVVD